MTTRVGVAATKAPWSAALRSYVRDHIEGVAVEVVIDRLSLRRVESTIDVLVIDDMMRNFSAADIARARELGAHVIGLVDAGGGMGREYLMNLGVDQVVIASTPPADLMATISQFPRRPLTTAAVPHVPARPASRALAGPRRPRPGQVSVWTKVSGGPGLTECVVAAADYLGRGARVLVIEAEEVTPVLVSRLVRSAEGGLPWALSRMSQGLQVFPDALSGGRDDGAPPLGRFDVICAAPGAAPGASAAQLERLVSEAVELYDFVLFETRWATSGLSTRDRRGTALPVLSEAGSIIVIAAADPEGAARLVQWRAWAVANGIRGRCWAAFGRAGQGRYEREHLLALVDANTGRHAYAGIRFLPEDRTVMRARWNAEMVWKGPWLGAVHHLVDSSLASATAPAAPPTSAVANRSALGTLAP